MQRPTRIVVFGVLCLAVGFLAGIKNSVDLMASIGGPGLMQWMQETSGGQGLPESFKEQNEKTYAMLSAALRQPAYRAGLGVKAAVGVAMAGLLVFAGIGLLLDKLWSVRLARYWGFYALVAGAVTVVLESRYVLPQSTDGPPGSEIVGAACALPMLWLFPILLLTMLGRPVVIDYLRWRQQAPRAVGSAQAASDQAMQTRADQALQSPSNQPTAPRPTASIDSAEDEPGSASRQTPDQSSSQTPPTQTPPRHGTWRDDPWNDPSSR